MLKALLAATVLSGVVLPLAGDAQAEQRFRRFNPIYAFDYAYDNDFEDEALIDDADEDEIIVPRRRDRRDWVYDPDADEFIYRPRKNTKPKVKPKVVVTKPVAKPSASARRALSDAEKRRVAAITGKPQASTPVRKPKVQAAVLPKSEATPVAKPVSVPKIAEKPASVKPVIKQPTPVVAAPAPVATPSKSARLVLPPEPAPKPFVAAPKVASTPGLSPKSQRLTPISPVQSAISCDKAAGIVTGFGFTGVSPQLCVGKTYAFKAMRDGKQFEVRISSANGELTEVRKL
jgi:hypothetical protein